MITDIRPHQLFSLLSESYRERIVRVVLPYPLPQRQYTTYPPLIKTACLVALTKIIKAKTFFEFGTLLGVTSLNIAMNLGSPAKLFTLDLDRESFKRARQSEHDRSLSLDHFECEDKLAFLDTLYKNRIVRLYGDSNKFDFSPFYKKVDMVYIDGGHDYRTVKSDTGNAFKMLKADSKVCIVWDDYGSKRHYGVTEYLEELSSEKTIFHMGETPLCIYANFHIPTKDSEMENRK